MDDQNSSSVGIDDAVAQFETYEDYLDSQITATDLFYLEDEEVARQLVELGYRGSGETLKREEFNSRKKALAEAMLAKEQQKK
uniref:Cilia- and flagella-associated protein 299 n=1 Tax=Schistosoma mansoni TaxID=6183 RepID=A0A5K4EJY4_SCHMA